MRLEPVGSTNRGSFIEYCRRFGGEHDASYLPGDDFTVSADQPSYLLLDGSEVVGAVSLLRTPRYVDARRGRFAILHSCAGSSAVYARLYEAISRHFDGLETVYLFIPRERLETAAALTGLGFRVDRLTFVLCLSNPQVRQVQLGDGFRISPVRLNDAQAGEAFAELVNLNFATSPGHVSIAAADIWSWLDSGSYVEDGICLLYKDGQPIGTVCVARDLEDGSAAIELLSVRDDYRGRRLGRQLLRHAVNLAITDDLAAVYLSVRGENDSAVRLYLSEGFEMEETVACYSRLV